MASDITNRCISCLTIRLFPDRDVRMEKRDLEPEQTAQIAAAKEVIYDGSRRRRGR